MSILIPMSEEKYSSYFKETIISYARTNVETGRWDEAGAVE